jgi:hypothetical protein
VAQGLGVGHHPVLVGLPKPPHRPAHLVVSALRHHAHLAHHSNHNHFSILMLLSVQCSELQVLHAGTFLLLVSLLLAVCRREKKGEEAAEWSKLSVRELNTASQDFWEMFVHHVATIALMVLSWTCHLHRWLTIVLSRAQHRTAQHCEVTICPPRFPVLIWQGLVIVTQLMHCASDTSQDWILGVTVA